MRLDDEGSWLNACEGGLVAVTWAMTYGCFFNDRVSMAGNFENPYE